MPSKRKKKAARAEPAVPKLVEHPHQDAITQVSKLILGADARVNESVKWNAPNFSVGERDFATFHLRSKQGVQLILHFGAKKHSDLKAREAVADPAHLLHWLADDRATITWQDLAEVRAKRAAFVKLIKAWIAASP